MKPLSSPVSIKAVWKKGEWFQEKVPFEFRVEKSIGVTESDGGDDETDELRELGWEEWEKEWPK